MKINRIKGLETKSSTLENKKKENNYNFSTKPSNVRSAYLDSEISKNYYISFKMGNVSKSVTDASKMKDIESAMTSTAKDLLNSSRQIAKKYGYPVINQAVVLLASLLGLKDYINEINNGNIDFADVTKYYIPLVIGDETTDDVFKDDEKREILSTVIDSQIKLLSKNIDNNKPAKPTISKSKINLASDFIVDLISRYNLENSQPGLSDGFVHDSTILYAAFCANKDNYQKNVK